MDSAGCAGFFGIRLPRISPMFYAQMAPTANAGLIVAKPTRPAPRENGATEFPPSPQRPLGLAAADHAAGRSEQMFGAK
jgi:hypothetical protein